MCADDKYVVIYELSDTVFDKGFLLNILMTVGREATLWYPEIF